MVVIRFCSCLLKESLHAISQRSLEGDVEAVKVLIDAGINVNAPDQVCMQICLEIGCILLLEKLGESGATHDSQSTSRSGVEAHVARNLNG